MKIEGKFIEVSIAAQRLNVSESTIKRLIRDDKEIIAVRIRGTYRIPESSLDAYLTKMQQVVADE